MELEYLVYTNNGYCEFLGPSSATKPTRGMRCGIWVETDTGDVYAFDDVNGWGNSPIFHFGS